MLIAGALALRPAAADRRRAGVLARRLDPRRDPRAAAAGCARSSASASSWSPTTSGWPGTSPTGSRSCTSAGSSSAAPPRRCSQSPRHPYTQALLSVVPEMERLEPVVLTGEIPDPTRIPGGCRFHPRCPALADGRAAAAGVAEQCADRAAVDRLGHRAATAPPATWSRHWPATLNLWPGAGVAVTRLLLLTRESVTGRRPDARRSRCRLRCPARCTSTRRTWLAEREVAAVRRVVLPRAARRPRAGRRRRASPTVDVAGESVLVTSDERRRAARGLQRLPAPRLADPADGRAGGTTRGLRPVGAALPVPLVDLRPRRPAAEAPHTELTDATSTTFRAARRSAWRPGAASCSCTSRPSGATPLAEAVARAGGDAGQLRAGRPGHRRDAAPTTWPPTTRCCWRTTTSATTAARCTRSCRRLVPAFAGGGDPTSTGTTASRTARAPGRSPRPAPRPARRCPA